MSLSCTVYEIFSVISQKLKRSRDPEHIRLEKIYDQFTSACQYQYEHQICNCLPSPVLKIWLGPNNLKMGHVILTTPTAWQFAIPIYTIIKIVRSSVTVGDRGKRRAASGWLAGDTDGLTGCGWAVTVGVVEVCVAARYRCACLHCMTSISAASTGGVLVLVLDVACLYTKLDNSGFSRCRYMFGAQNLKWLTWL